MYTAYIWTALNGISVVVNGLAILVLMTWSDLTFFDDDGEIHTLRFGSPGLIFLTFLKIIGCVLCAKWGLDALETFRPIIKEVERE